MLHGKTPKSVREMYSPLGCETFKNKAGFAEVKHGKWVNVPFTQLFKCSLYGKEIYFGKDKFCNECGSRMDGDT